MGNALALSTYPQAGARFAAQQAHTWRREYPSGCDQTGTAPTSTAKSGIGAVPPHGAKHACRGIIPLVLVCVHVRLHPRRTRQRHGSSCARAAGLKYSSAAAATVAKFTVPAPVHKKRVRAPSKKPAGAIRQPPPGANWLYRARMKIVTHQGSPPRPRNDVVPADAVPLAAAATASKPAAVREVVMRPRPPEPGFLHCHWCGARCSPVLRNEFLRRRQRGSSHDRRQRKPHDHPS